VGLPWELLGSPSSGNSLESVTLGDTDDVDDLVLLCEAEEKGKNESATRKLRRDERREKLKERRRTEDRLDVEGLLEVTLGESNLVGDGSSVDLEEEERRKKGRDESANAFLRLEPKASRLPNPQHRKRKKRRLTWISMR